MLGIPEITYTKGHIITVWGWGLSIGEAFDKSLPMLEQCQPQGVQLHGGWEWLIKQAPDVTAQARALGYSVWWGIAGDGDKGTCHDRWHKVMEAAVACGSGAVDAIVINTEMGWLTSHTPEIELAYDRMRKVSQDSPHPLNVMIGHTSFGQPVWYPEQKFGGFPEYPWTAFCNRADFIHPQVYYQPLKSRYDGYERAWAEMRDSGRVRGDLPTHVYLACATDPGTVASPPDVNAWIAGHHESICWWTLPGMDDNGRLSLLTCCKLWNLGEGYRGPWGIDDAFDHVIHPVARYQEDNGLTIDGWAGPQTREALGVG